MTRKRAALIGAACALAGSASTAIAATTDPNLLGNGGTVYVFDAACHRISVLPPGISDHEMINVIGQQSRCLVRRPTFAACVHKLGPPPITEKADHGAGKPGDEAGAKAWANAVYKCSKGTF